MRCKSLWQRNWKCILIKPHSQMSKIFNKFQSIQCKKLSNLNLIQWYLQLDIIHLIIFLIWIHQQLRWHLIHLFLPVNIHLYNLLCIINLYQIIQRYIKQNKFKFQIIKVYLRLIKIFTIYFNSPFKIIKNPIKVSKAKVIVYQEFISFPKYQNPSDLFA